MIKMRITLGVFASVVVLALLGAVGVSSAIAEPTGEFAVFKECPITHSPKISGCLVSRVEKGEIKLGKEEVPILKTQTLQGGWINEGVGKEGFTIEKFVGAAGGNTLSKTPQKVPGGLAGLVECYKITGNGFWEVIERGSCEFFFENSVTGVNATTELSAPASSIGINQTFLLLEVGTGLSLPIKVKLENPLLGEECYVGPITLNLTTGKSGALTGRFGKTHDKAGGNILEIKENKLVEEGFSAPKATGCGEFFSFIVDPIINSKIGLPAEKGDTATLEGTVEETSRDAVEENEEEA
jgi:hypothetical protein